MPTVTLVTMLFCMGVGSAVLWSNPYRFANLVFALNSVLITLWLVMVYGAVVTGISLDHGHAANPVPWLRANAAVVAFLPAGFWLMKESILTEESERRRTITRLLPWCMLGTLLVLLCITDSFILSRAPSRWSVRGNSYYLFNFILICGTCVPFVQGWRQMRSQAGIRRIELQFILLAFGTTCILVPALNSAGNFFHLQILNRAGVPVVFLCYAFTAWAVTFHRIFDARQVFLAVSQRISLILLLGFGIWSLWHLGEEFLPSLVSLFLSLVIWSAAAFWLDRKSREWLRLGGEELLAEFRSAVIAVARNEPNPDILVERFQFLLCERAKTSFATLLFDDGKNLASENLELSKERAAYAAISQAGWATPENLQRRRPAPGVKELRQFLAQDSLGLVVTAPRGSPTPSLMLALGTKKSRWPYTYPEVQRLQNIAELMDNILTHARLAEQAALEAKTEHLALMSRGLAHDLKNLITPISSFIVHTDGQFDRASPEGEVHAAAKRSVRIMTDYVREALLFSSRLTPNFERADLARVLETVRELTSARAAERRVEVVIAPGESHAITADAVLLQRLLGNLVNNAIDASNPGGKVTLGCAARESGWIRIEVLDQGCGIVAENLERIFDPYFTTKQFGDEVRGFGLGLTICEKIVDLHQGSILVRSEVGRGTNVTVDLPAAPSAFAPVREDTMPT